MFSVLKKLLTIGFEQNESSLLPVCLTLILLLFKESKFTDIYIKRYNSRYIWKLLKDVCVWMISFIAPQTQNNIYTIVDATIENLKYLLFNEISMTNDDTEWIISNVLTSVKNIKLLGARLFVSYIKYHLDSFIVKYNDSWQWFYDFMTDVCENVSIKHLAMKIISTWTLNKQLLINLQFVLKAFINHRNYTIIDNTFIILCIQIG